MSSNKPDYYMIRQALKICLFALVSVSAYGQKFTITGYGEEIKDGDSLFLAYKENGRFVLKTTTAQDKKFVFTGSVQQPVKAYISRNENPRFANVITESIHVFLESGEIIITSSDTLTGGVLSGTDLNETLQTFENQQEELKKRKRSVKDPDLFTELQKKDTALVQAQKKEIEKLFYEDANNKLAFAMRHPASYVSLDMLYEVSRINTYIYTVEEVYITLADTLKQTAQGIAIRERIKKKKQLSPGMEAFDFVMNDVTGEAVRLSSFKGRFVLIDFWASWCGPCRENHPDLIAAYKAYKEKGFTIISISIDTDVNKWKSAIEKDKMTWTQTSDLKGDKGAVYLQYGITSIPANFLIDPNGIVISKDLTGDLLKNKLTEILSED